MAGNPILRHQTLTILQQIEELKNWHKQQQSKLGSGNTHEDKNNSPTKNIENLQDDRSKNSGEVQREKSKHNPNLVHNFDEIPIKVANPNSTQFIENNIMINGVKPGDPLQEGEKPKFRFLKKGEGIARFRMGPIKISSLKKGNSRTLKLSNNINKPDDHHLNQNENDKKIDSEKESCPKRDEIPTLNPPDLKLNFKNWKNIFSSGKAEEIIEKAIDNNQLELFQPNSSIDSSTASIMEKLLAAGKRHLKEREELRVFETMEQHVLDSSFCSTSSYVTRLMENAVISTPVKKTFANRNSLGAKLEDTTVPADTEKTEAAGQKYIKLKRPTTPIWEEVTDNMTVQQDVVNAENFDQSLHVRFAEEIDYKSFIEQSQSLNNETLKETNGIKEFNESEEWKEDSGEDSICCSQCSTTYSSSDEDARVISPPVQPPLIQHYHQSRRTTNRSDTQNCKRRSPIENLGITDLKTNGTQVPENTLSSNDGMDKFPPVLSAKLKELEDEINIFRDENNKLKALRQSLEKEHKQFQQEKKHFMKDLEEEKKKNAAHIEEEKQKLAKEKLTFEKYSKSLKNNPTKEERKEIQGLREQLSEMKEELNKKESRWGAAQARVRNQVKHLEADNKKLREEVEILRKQSKHLEFLTQKKKSKPLNNTKLIHTINDHISNIPVNSDDNVKIISSGGSYFQQKNDTVKTVTFNDLDPKSLDTVKVIREAISKPEPGSNSPNVSAEPTGQCNNSLLSDQDQLREKAKFRNKDLVTSQENVQNPDNRKTSQIANISNDHLTDSIRETVNADGTVQKVYPDGKKEIRYKNGNLKKFNPLTGNEKTIYFNGDVKEITKDGTVKYYFSESRIWHTTLPDGLEVLDFPNGQVEKRHISGVVEIIYPNDCRKLTYPDGAEEIYYADGTTLKVEANKRKVLSLPNGQKEIHTDECIRREYPDGTVKIVYPDGTTETVYSNGRVRLKDKHGNLVMDSGTIENNRL